MDTKRIMILLDDPSDFTIGPALSDLGVEFNDTVERGLLKAIDIRENRFREWCEKLADELNSALSGQGWEVRLVHLDTADYLEFVGLPAGDSDADQD